MTERAGGRPSGTISASVPDWSREQKSWLQWAPSRSLLSAIRSYQLHQGRRSLMSHVARGFAVFRHRFWSAVTGAEIPLNCSIGGGMLIPHPNGIVIHSSAVIGPNCLIMQQVTIGIRCGGIPSIGGHVDIGAGAKILGGVKIGDHAKIGANALVIHDVPAGGVAMAPLAVIRHPIETD